MFSPKLLTLLAASLLATAAPAQTTVDNFNEAGIPVNHIVMEGKGHEFPDDFEGVLQEALKKIYQ